MKGKLFSMSLAENANNANLGGENEESAEQPEMDMSMLFNISAEVKDYGMTGAVILHTYTKVNL